MQTMQKTCSLNHSKLQYCAKVMQVNFNKSLGFWGLKKSRLKQYFNEFSLHYIFVMSTYDVPPCESRWLQISDGDAFSYLNCLILFWLYWSFCFYLFRYAGHAWKPGWTWKAWAWWKTGKYNKFNNGIFTQMTNNKENILRWSIERFLSQVYSPTADV